MISDSIPVELNLDILSRLPEKSVARFRCVSKVWASILGGQDFKDLFLAKSSTQPRLLFGIEENNKWSIYSLPQRPSQYEKLSSSVVFPPGDMEIYSYAHEFHMFYFYVDKEIWSHVGRAPMICNPKTTGRYEVLPYIRRYRKTIMTLGTMGMRWRKIKCSLRHECVSSGICINGVLYYLGDLSDYYKGKLGLVYYDDQSDNAIKLRVWVLEHVEKQEWSKYAFTLRDDRFFLRHVFVVGVNSTGELILSMAKYMSKQPFYVFYFNPETDTLQRVEIQGFGECHESSDEPSTSVYVFANHVDDLHVHDSKLLKSSISVPYVYREESEEEDKE
ncbi:hypothetical protein N665_0817s0014 [Sinapis alba]|nr:hypothetical protein N665_0817s0014 [Sinapis alba]